MWKRLLCLALVFGSLSAAASAADTLKITDVKTGSGPKVASGDLVTVLYVGKLGSGKIFDSNTGNDDNPFSFVVGAASVIQGWDRGILGMKKGGVRDLRIPPDLGYGQQAQRSIPPGSTLFFQIRLLDIVKKGEETVYDKAVLKVGTGKVASNGMSVTISYVGKLLNGKKFDSRVTTFTLGRGQALKAIEMALKGMREGGKCRLRLPPAIAFGARGLGGTVPGNSVVIFEIELRKVTKAKR